MDLLNRLPYYGQQASTNFFVEDGYTKKVFLKCPDALSEAFIETFYSHERTNFYFKASFSALPREMLHKQHKKQAPLKDVCKYGLTVLFY